jgi:hypothetical protein
VSSSARFSELRFSASSSRIAAATRLAHLAAKFSFWKRYLRLLLRRGGNTVYTHCMRRIAAVLLLCVFGALLPTATVVALAAPQQLLPICCRAHGAHACVMGLMASTATDAGPTLHRAACPFGQELRAITTVTISADFACRSSFNLNVVNIDRPWIADAVATRMLRRSAPRGPPSSVSL